MTERATSPAAATITLRVSEARVEDIAHAIARLAPGDLERIGARAGNVLKITGRTVAVARAEVADIGPEGQKDGFVQGFIQIDGTIRSNCGTGLEEHVVVALMESSPAVAVRL